MIKAKKILVIGGGAAGLIAAGCAALKGGDVTILEKMPRPGLKLRITGKGRCNLTNNTSISDFEEHLGPDSRFLRNAFARFFAPELIEFFDSIGIKTNTERGGRVFPESGDAKSLADALINWAKNCGAEIRCNTSVRLINKAADNVTGITTVSGIKINADSVILATGGCSYPATGSTGDGFFMAEKCGHKINLPKPVLVPLETDYQYLKELAGLDLKNVRIDIYQGNKKKTDLFGDMSFLENAISGPIILSLSRKIIDDITNGEHFRLNIDLKPALEHKTLDARLLREISDAGGNNLSSLLRKLLPRQMISAFIARCGLVPEMLSANITADQRKKIRTTLKEFPLNITGHRGFDEAIVTRGGVSTREIDPNTMESKIVHDLFLAGEVIDLDADTGGYNLQIAFTTGWIAGNSV